MRFSTNTAEDVAPALARTSCCTSDDTNSLLFALPSR
jgi:hypothetical protein